MLIEDTGIRKSLRAIITRSGANQALHEDLMQECLVRLWRLESEGPGHTRSWYLQNCRFHLQHYLAAGRSLDSLKRADGDKRITIDGVSGALPFEGYDTNGELLELVCARDIVTTLECHLNHVESALLGALADGLVLRDIAVKLKLSYPTALKYRRRIAALTIKLGISPPPPHKKRNRRNRSRQVNGDSRRNAGVQINDDKNRALLPDSFPASRDVELNVNGRRFVIGIRQRSVANVDRVGHAKILHPERTSFGLESVEA